MPPYDVVEYIRRGREVDLIDSKRLSVMPRVDGDTTVVRVRGGTRRAKTNTEGWRTHWKHWTNIPKSYMFDVRVDLFWAWQLQEYEYVVEMYDLISRIRDGPLTLSTENNWDVRIQSDLHELY